MQPVVRDALRPEEVRAVVVTWRPLATLPTAARFNARCLLYSPAFGVHRGHFVYRTADGEVRGATFEGSPGIGSDAYTHWAPDPHPERAGHVQARGSARVFAFVFVTVGMLAATLVWTFAPGEVDVFLSGMAASAVAALVAGGTVAPS